MRNLTIKQKNLLRKWYKEAEPTPKEKMLFSRTNLLRSVDDLSSDRWEELQRINDTEILFQNVNSFLWDLRNEEN